MMKKVAVVVLRVGLVLALVGNSASAAESTVLPGTTPPPAPVGGGPIFVPGAVAYGGVNLPSHISAGNQVFETSVAGLRSYLEGIKPTDPQLYVQLAPDLEGLEARATGARVLLLTGLGVGVVSTVYAFAGQSSCQGPSVTDPTFAADSAAWGACNDDNLRKMATFTLLGLGAVLVGAVGWYALTPGRSDYFDFVNKHNRLSPQPLQFQIGYDGARRLATGGAGFVF
jgi:hypothetical protein